MSSIAVDSAAAAVATMCAAAMLAIGLSSPPLAIVVAIMLVLIPVAAMRPMGAVAATVATLPWFYHPIAVGSQRVAPSELLLAISVAAFGTLEIYLALRSRDLARFHPRSAFQRVSMPLPLTLSLLTMVGLVLALFPYDPAHRAESLREWRWTFLEPLVLVVLLTMGASRRSDRTLVAFGLMAGGMVAAGQAFLDLVTGGGVDVAGITRIAGPYPHPNALALFEARIAALAFAWWVYSSRRSAWLLVPAAIVGLAAAATLSRGAMLAMLVAGALTLPHLPRVMRAVAVVATTVAFGTLTVVARDRMLDLFSGGSGSLRVDIWTSAIKMISARPFAGYGPDQFLYAYLPRYVQPTAWGERFTAHAHNIVFDFWIRLGIIGLAFTMMVGVVCARLTLRTIQGRSDGALRAAATVALVASLTHGLIDNAYFAHDLAMSGWLLAWFALGQRVTDSPEGVDGGARPGYGRRRIHRFSSLR